MTIAKKGNALYLRKRTPAKYAGIEPRKEIWLALNTDSQREARAKAPQIWAVQVDGWEAMLAGRSADAQTRYNAAKALAAARGFKWMPIERVAELPMNELLDRLEASMTPEGEIDPVLGDAFMGAAKKPQIMLSSVLDTYWDLTGDKERGKSDDQIRRMRNPRKKAFTNIRAVIGDKALTEITQDDLLDFRAWWWEKITEEDLDPASGNKDFTHIASTLKVIDRAKRLDLKLTYAALNFAVGDKRTRKPFSRDWIVSKILAPGALHSLNLEARCILLGMINTGYRPSEAQDLLPQHIRLDGPVPHISIEPVGRTLKTQASQRLIPLVGVSLEAFKLCPQGFPRYRGSPNLSATVNKFMRENGLMQTTDHTLYGLRHSMEDRMLAAGVDERIRRDVLGHALGRERYGDGASLEQLAATLQSVAL
jgi:integrase